MGRPWTPAVVMLALSGTALAAPDETPRASPAIDATYDPRRSFADLVDAVRPAVLSLEVQGVVRQESVPGALRPFFGPYDRVIAGEGSGFIISPKGEVVTNHHVIDGAEVIQARLPGGERVTLEVVGSDPAIDIALLKLPDDRTWPHVELGSSDDVRVGDWVLAAGNPLALGLTVTAGIISGKSRTISDSVYEDYLQTDAAINEGNSGGPLFDIDGRVIGVNTANVPAANTIGFAVPIDLVQRSVDDLRKHGHVARGYLGVLPKTITPELATALELDPDVTGVVLSEVVAEQPGDRRALRPGDVITHVEDVPVALPADLFKVIADYRPGDRVRLDTVREGKARKVKVRLAERPDTYVHTPRRPLGRLDSAQSMGLQLEDLTDEVAAGLGIHEGVLVRSVSPMSPAHGLLDAGDVLVRVNNQGVTSVEDVDLALESSGFDAMFVVLREGSEELVRVPVG